MNILMISMDDSILTGAIGDARARHEDYARRFGRIQMVVCNTVRKKPLQALDTELLSIVPTNSRTRIAYVADALRVARPLIDSQPPDVITSQDALLTGLVGLRLRDRLHVPLIVQDHTTIADGERWAQESLQNRLLQRIACFVLPRADAVRVVSEGERAACIRIGVQPKRLQVIPVATDLRRFAEPDNRIDWRARLGLSASDRVALWVGRPVPFKNLPLLISAFEVVSARLDNARLVLAGDMSGTGYIEQVRAAGLDHRIKFAGRVGHDDLPSLYQAADVYAHSSFYEGLPRVQMEAAAAGLPIVSTDIDGVRDLVRPGETGLLTPLDAESLAAALIDLLSDPERSRAMGARGQRDVLERFDPERLINQWVGMWKALATRKMQR